MTGFMIKYSPNTVLFCLVLTLAGACGSSEEGESATAFGPGDDEGSAEGLTGSESSASGASAESSTSDGSSSEDSSEEDSSEASAEDEGSSDESTDSGPLLDVGGMESSIPTDSEGGDDECKKIDFLFVIDNSNSMSDEQQSLVSAFPEFIDAINSTLPDATDLHIGVTRTDIHGFDNSPTPDPSNPCPYVMGGLISSSTPFDEKTGTGPSCGFASGENYMTQGANLATEFACAAAVGTKGNTGERQAEATLAALSGPNVAPGGCSDGFLRDDALLVVTVISDEDDDWSPPDADANTNADAWHAGVVDAKLGIETNVVFLLISGGSPKWPTCGALDLGNNTGADDSPKLTTWANSFSNVEHGNVCEAGYADYLSEAISTIETACDGFIPPG